MAKNVKKPVRVNKPRAREKNCAHTQRTPVKKVAKLTKRTEEAMLNVKLAATPFELLLQMVPAAKSVAYLRNPTGVAVLIPSWSKPRRELLECS